MADLMKEHSGQNRGENAGIVQIKEQGEDNGRGGSSGGDLYPAAAQIAAM